MWKKHLPWDYMLPLRSTGSFTVGSRLKQMRNPSSGSLRDIDHDISNL